MLSTMESTTMTRWQDWINLQYSNYRRIALVSNASKIILMINLERIQTKTELELAEKNSWFSKGLRDKESDSKPQDTWTKKQENTKKEYMCFMNFMKTFDSVKHVQLWLKMRDTEYPPHIVQLLTQLYRKQKAKY